MPNKYLIQAPHGTEVPEGISKQVTAALNAIGVPSDDGWRYVVLPEQNWQDVQSAYGPYLTDHSNTAYTYPHGKVVYLRQRMFPLTDQTLLFTLAHEFAHRYLNTTDENKANAYAQNVIEEVRKYGRSNLAALNLARTLPIQNEGELQPQEPSVPLLLRKSGKQ